jgi:SAM-dependent methyltransferase
MLHTSGGNDSFVERIFMSVESMAPGSLVGMNPMLLNYICCPRCKGDLVVSEGSVENLINGMLDCVACHARYRVREGVPILIADLTEAERLTAKNFGEQWTEVSTWKHIEEWEENEFNDYMLPLNGAVFAGKTCLEGGCGYGRNLIQAKGYGSTLAIGFDVGVGAIIAKRRGIDAISGDILNPPFKGRFDIVFTFGVLQHVSNPDQGIQKLYELLKPGALFIHSVYSAENNFLLSHLLTPVRERVLRYLPPWIKWAIAWMAGVPTYIMFSLVYRPFSWHPRTNAWASSHLFYYDFLALHFKRLGFRIWISFIQDHINAPLAKYFSRATVERWLKEYGLTDPFVFFRNKNTWNFGGRRIAADEAASRL